MPLQGATLSRTAPGGHGRGSHLPAEEKGLWTGLKLASAAVAGSQALVQQPNPTETRGHRHLRGRGLAAVPVSSRMTQPGPVTAPPAGRNIPRPLTHAGPRGGSA